MISPELVGKRKPKQQPLFEPHELGYACPICEVDNEVDLTWSEYNGMLWCHKCKKDIPSCLCVKYPEPRISDEPLSKEERVEKATQVYLMVLGAMVKKNE